jgi:hypothetical protein
MSMHHLASSIHIKGKSNNKKIIDSSCNLHNIRNADVKSLNVSTSATVAENLIVSQNIQTDSLDVNDLIIHNTTQFNGAVEFNGGLNSDHIDSTYTLVKVFEGTTVTVGDEVQHILYNQTNHSRSIVDLQVLIHDVNSNTFWRYLHGEYMWYREWTTDPQELVLGTPVDVGSGEPFDYTIERLQINNDIVVKITQNTSIDTNTKYKLIAKIIQNDF